MSDELLLPSSLGSSAYEAKLAMSDARHCVLEYQNAEVSAIFTQDSADGISSCFTPPLAADQTHAQCLPISAATIRHFPLLTATGFTSRVPTQGPEYKLVETYIRACIPAAPRGQARAIFIEPRIASGCPDIVVAYWHVGTARRWSRLRATLPASDLRILHYMSSVGSVDLKRLQAVFPRGVTGSLERLHAADLIRPVARDTWMIRALSRIFALRRLVAIEAKIGEWRAGLQQALQNTWFASESYLLVTHIPRRSSLVPEAARLGVGVVTYKRPFIDAEAQARPERLPRSYASWLFNDWAWRASIGRDLAQEQRQV